MSISEEIASLKEKLKGVKISGYVIAKLDSAPGKAAVFKPESGPTPDRKASPATFAFVLDLSDSRIGSGFCQ